MSLFYVVAYYGFAGNTKDLDDQYGEVAEGKICCMLGYQALYRSLGRDALKL